MKSVNWRISVLVLLVTTVACSGKNEEAGDANDAGNAREQASLLKSSEEAPAAKLKDLGALVDLIVAEANELPRAEFDPAALAKKLGNDPEAIFSWVRDHTWWAPYRGLLRGPKGVMLDRIGSSLDRAVLLGDLLRNSGYTVRLAHAEFPEARARELLGKIGPIPAHRRVPVEPKDMPAERRRAMTALIPTLEQEIEKELAAASRTMAEAESLVRAQSSMLLAAVREAASPGDSDESEAVSALKEHWWIERKDGDKWVAMDVLLPDAAMGKALALASSISVWEGKDAFPEIPETSWHTVQLRVVIERYHAGATSESTVLETLLRPAEYLERPISLGHMPRPWPDEFQDAGKQDALRETALGVREWVPYIQAGEDLIVQSGFSIQGDLRSDPLESADIGKVGGAEVASGMDMALGGFGVDEAVPAATAEWLDYEIRVPGRPPRVCADKCSIFWALHGAQPRPLTSTGQPTFASLSALKHFSATRISFCSHVTSQKNLSRNSLFPESSPTRQQFARSRKREIPSRQGNSPLKFLAGLRLGARCQAWCYGGRPWRTDRETRSSIDPTCSATARAGR